MEIVSLPKGETPPADTDCIRIYSDENGAFELMGAAMCDGESVSFVGEQHYPSADAAINVGLAWANETKVAKLYVAINPALSEADKPL